MCVINIKYYDINIIFINKTLIIYLFYYKDILEYLFKLYNVAY